MNDPINEDFSMDNGLVCRWMTGQAKISPKIASYYAKPSNQKKLAATIQRNLLPLMADCNMVVQDIYTLFMQDDTISDTKKQEVPKPCRHFLGREEELEELHTMFEQNRHIFLYGIAGIGKSEFAKAYAKKYKKQ